MGSKTDYLFRDGNLDSSADRSRFANEYGAQFGWYGGTPGAIKGGSKGSAGGIGSVNKPKSSGGGTSGGAGTSAGSGFVLPTADDRYLPGYTEGLKAFGPRLIETRVAFSLYGTPIPITFGIRKLQGNIIWAKELEEERKIQQVNGVVYTSYGYFGTFAIAFGIPGNASSAGRIVQRIWADGNLIYDTVNSKVTRGAGIQFNFYEGTSTQIADPIIESVEGAGNVPGYRGIMYMVFNQLPLAPYENKIPAIVIQVADTNAVDDSFVQISSADANGSGAVYYDPDFNESYALNDPYLLKYDLNTETYLGKVFCDTAQLGGYYGFYNGVAIYMPWCKRLYGMSDFPQIDADYIVVNPRTGVADATFEMSQASEFTARLWKTAFGGVSQKFTLIGSSSVYGHIEFATYDALSGGQKIKRFSNKLPNNSYPCTFGSGTNPYECNFYIRSDASGTTLAKYSIPAALGIGGDEDLITITDNQTFYAYNGAYSPTSITRLLYFPNVSNGVIVIMYNNLEKVGIDENGNVLWRLQPTENVPNGGASLQNCEMQNGDLEGDKFAILSGSTVYELNVRDGTYKTFTVTGASVNDNYYLSYANDGIVMSLADTTEYFTKLEYNTGANTISLGTLITQLALRAGYTAPELDIDAGVDDVIQGAILTETTSLAEMLEQIKTIYGYEVIESGDVLKVTNNLINQTSPHFTITEDDILDADPSFSFRREEDVALPNRVELTYINADIGYEYATAFAQRSVVNTTNQSDNKLEITVPFIIDADTAKQLAYRILYTAWGTRETYAFGLPKYYTEVEPGDVIRATIDSMGFYMRAVDVTYGNDYSLQIAAQSWQNAEQFYVESFSGYTYTTVIEATAVYKGFLLDIPNVKQADYAGPADSTYYWVALPSQLTDTYNGTTGWLGYNFPNVPIQQENYESLGASKTTALPWGTITATGPKAKYGIECALDRDSTINVAIEGGDVNLLQTDTYANVMAGANLAAIGHSGGWELIRFLTVTAEADGTYTFSDIIRGQYGTPEMSRQICHALFYLQQTNAAFSTQYYYECEGSTCRLADKFVFLGDIDELTRGTFNGGPSGYNLDSSRISTQMRFAGADKQSDAALNFDVISPLFHDCLAPAVGNSIEITRSKSTGVCTINWNPAYTRMLGLQDNEIPDPPLAAYESGVWQIWMLVPSYDQLFSNPDDVFPPIPENYGTNNSITRPDTGWGIGTINMATFPRNDSRYYADSRIPLQQAVHSNPRLVATVDATQTSYEMTEASGVDTYRDSLYTTLPVIAGAYDYGGLVGGARVQWVWVAIVQLMDGLNYAPTYLSGFNQENPWTESHGRAQWHRVPIKDV